MVLGKIRMVLAKIWMVLGKIWMVLGKSGWFGENPDGAGVNPHGFWGKSSQKKMWKRKEAPLKGEASRKCRSGQASGPQNRGKAPGG